jgi:hypothetical protein
MTLYRPPAKGVHAAGSIYPKLLASIGAVTVLLKDHLGAIGRRKLREIFQLISIVGETSKCFSRQFSV